MGQVSAEEVSRWIDEYGPRVTAIAQSFAGGAVGPEDIFQETFLRAWRNGPATARDTNEGAWICSIALNVGRDAYRRRHRREGLLKRRPREAPGVSGSPSIGEELHRKRLWRAIAELPERQRAVLLRRIVREDSAREVGKELGIEDGTVRATCRDAIRSLRRILGPEDLDRMRAVRWTG